MKTYVIADIAGRHRELLKLIEQFEQPCNIVQAGDFIDRGPGSNQVVEYLMQHPEITTIFGNHEWMMLMAHNRKHEVLDYVEPNCFDSWYHQGGRQTLASFDGKIPDNVLDWVSRLPLEAEVRVDDKLYRITHAPVPRDDDPWHERPVQIWNRYQPKRDTKYAWQIYGHNSKLEWVADNDGTYAVCIDDCRNKHLTAVELPSMKIFHQVYE